MSSSTASPATSLGHEQVDPRGFHALERLEVDRRDQTTPEVGELALVAGDLDRHLLHHGARLLEGAHRAGHRVRHARLDREDAEIRAVRDPHPGDAPTEGWQEVDLLVERERVAGVIARQGVQHQGGVAHRARDGPQIGRDSCSRTHSVASPSARARRTAGSRTPRTRRRGIRIEPPPSVPSANGSRPSATAPALPPEDPPVFRVRSKGLRLGPKSGLSHVPQNPITGALVLPTTIAPATQSARRTRRSNRAGSPPVPVSRRTSPASRA
jgi:hypothetical protein